MRWHLLRGLRRHAEQGPVPAGPYLRAKQATTVAIEFLGWLDGRGRSLAECTQHDVDVWFAGGTSTRRQADRFLYWARSHRLTSRLEIPRAEFDTAEGVGEQERLRIIAELLLHDTLPLAYRLAGCLIGV